MIVNVTIVYLELIIDPLIDNFVDAVSISFFYETFVIYDSTIVPPNNCKAYIMINNILEKVLSFMQCSVPQREIIFTDKRKFMSHIEIW